MTVLFLLNSHMISVLRCPGQDMKTSRQLLRQEEDGERGLFLSKFLIQVIQQQNISTTKGTKATRQTGSVHMNSPGIDINSQGD